MKERDLEEWEKDLIRDEIQKAVTNGSNLKQIGELRKDLRDMIGCSLSQVGSVSAWKRKGQSLILTPTISAENKNDSESESTGSNNDITAIATILPEKVNNEESENVDILKEEPKIDVIGISDSEGGYENMPYDYDIKNKWREIWRRKIIQQTSTDQRGEMKVLFFPGKECLEVPLYLDLGFKPENLYGYLKPGDKKIEEDFRSNAAKYGLEPRVADLEKDLGKEYLPDFDVVSLDFPGEFCEKYHRICSKISLARKAIVMVNVMGKREKERSKQIMGMLEKVANGTAIDDLEEASGIIKPGSTPYEREVQAAKSDEFDKEHPQDLAITRESLSHLGTIAVMGGSASRNWMFLEEIQKAECIQKCKDDEIFMRLRSAGGRLGPLTGRNLANALSRYNWHDSIESEIDNLLTLATGSLFLDSIFSRPYITSLEKYKYLSNDKSRSPFLTDIATIEVPRGEYADVSKTAFFLLQCVLAECSRSWGVTKEWFETRFFVRTRKGWELGVGGLLNKNDELNYATDKGIVCNIPMRTLCRDAKIHTEISEKHNLVKIKEGENIPRLNIE